MSERPHAKFLVSWTEANGFTRGQTCAEAEDANRLYQHVKDTDAVYGEIRRIGSITEKFSRGPVN